MSRQAARISRYRALLCSAPLCWCGLASPVGMTLGVVTKNNNAARMVIETYISSLRGWLPVFNSEGTHSVFAYNPDRFAQIIQL